MLPGNLIGGGTSCGSDHAPRSARSVSWGGPLQNLWITVSEPYEIILVLRCITNYKVAFPVTLTRLDTIQLRTTSHFVKAVRRATFRDEGEHLSFMTKKRAQSVSLLGSGEYELSRLLSLQSAKTSAQIVGALFSAKSAKSTAMLTDGSLTAEVQTLLNNAAGVIECATGGHGRCANSRCECRCHDSRVPW
jgi:hypothetical protein